MQTTERPITLEEFDALPETLLPCQLIEGKLVMAPSPDETHQTLVGTVFGEVYLHLRSRPHLGKVLVAPFDVQLADLNVYQPDVAFFCGDHLDRITDRRAIGAPDLVVEVLSPSTAHYDLNEKRLQYAHNGVAELWIVDPKGKHIRVYLLGQDADRPARLLKQGDVLVTELLPGFELPLNRLFL